MQKNPPLALALSPRLVDRYIFRQLLDYFLLGLVVFTLIAFFSDTLLKFIREVQQYGIPFSTLLTLVGLQLPRSISLVLPASSFLAVLMVYNQLNNHFEMISFRTGGISLWRLVAPAVVLGMGCSLLGLFLNNVAVPYANRMTEHIKNEIISKGTLPSGGKSFMYRHYDDQHNLVQMIYISRYHGRELGDSTIIDLSKNDVMQVVQAKSGQWHPRGGWKFENANIYLVAKDTRHSSAGHSEIFHVKNLINRSDEVEKQQEEIRKERQGTDIDSDNQPFWAMWDSIQRRMAQGLEVKKGHWLKLWEKVTLPLSSLVIILSAVPLALTPPRAGHNRGFVFAIVILFLFYVLHSVFNALAKVHLQAVYDVIGMPTWLTLMAWMPILLMMAIGCLLIQRKSNVL